MFSWPWSKKPSFSITDPLMRTGRETLWLHETDRQISNSPGTRAGFYLQLWPHTPVWRHLSFYNRSFPRNTRECCKRLCSKCSLRSSCSCMYSHWSGTLGREECCFTFDWTCRPAKRSFAQFPGIHFRLLTSLLCYILTVFDYTDLKAWQRLRVSIKLQMLTI